MYIGYLPCLSKIPWSNVSTLFIRFREVGTDEMLLMRGKIVDRRKINHGFVNFVHVMEPYVMKTRDGKVVKRTTWNSRRVDQR